jgi:choline kinase
MFTAKENQSMSLVNCERQINNKFISVYDDSVYDDETDEKTIEINF